MKPTHKKNMRTKPLRKWIYKAKGIRQKGGFAFLIPLFIAAGLSASSAAAAATLAGAVATGAAGAVGAYGANKIIKAVGGAQPSLMRRTTRRVRRVF